ncbi:lipid II flippase Amj family protein [Chitinophaga oryzae]|uniref:Lipid II flippase Amj n=1 Tax=Chitinophaga oryzae TaxID=2725414 RepID=A0AAE6ZJL6_9BACT|nr:lipid II flippase Amj family protein [Chitinophaga oryzae]QJB34431.1 lipid II flippase Amj family protein [Chitinophaga oryzae]QJB40948.1 lipid II flippase Amj family protein [Chitinophaga oryzae]
MTPQIIIVLVLTAVINLIVTLSFAVRIVGVTTGRIAITFSLFNILVLVSRTANTFQAPLLAKTVEDELKQQVTGNEGLFRLIILSCTIGSVIGAALIPSFQRMLSKAVEHFSVHRSVPRLLYLGFSGSGMQFIKENLKMPSRESITGLHPVKGFPRKMFLFNLVATAIMTISVLCCVYAAYLNPDYRTTASNLSGVINGVATLLMVLFIDPHSSVLTDDVVLGKVSVSYFRQYITYMVIARVAGTLLAQLLLLPGAALIAKLAEYV